MGLLDGLSGLLGGGGQGQGAQQILGELLSQGRPGASSGALGSILGAFGGGGGEQVQSMARASSLPVGDLLSRLAAHLPQAASEHAGVDAG